MYNLEELKIDRESWKNLKIVPVCCDYCKTPFDIKYGTLYNIIRRDADGLFCSRKCAGSFRAFITQNKYKNQGGKVCKRCGEFKQLDNFWPLPSPPYYRAECKRCRNYKPARQYSYYKDKAISDSIKFTLSLDQFLTFWNRPCFYCNSEIDNVSLEIMNQDLGYVDKNCISCCRGCKKIKNDMSHKDFINFCEKVYLNVKAMENV
jgi:hypothetical protein